MSELALQFPNEVRLALAGGVFKAMGASFLPVNEDVVLVADTDTLLPRLADIWGGVVMGISYTAGKFLRNDFNSGRCAVQSTYGYALVQNTTGSAAQVWMWSAPTATSLYAVIPAGEWLHMGGLLDFGTIAEGGTVQPGLYMRSDQAVTIHKAVPAGPAPAANQFPSFLTLLTQWL